MFKLSASSLNNLDGVNDVLIHVVNVALTLTPIDFGIPEYGGLRTPQEQYKLYTQGLSKCDGYERLSMHQSGLAVDVFAYVDGKASWDPVHLAQVWSAFHAASKIVEEELNIDVQLEWGGNWKTFKDYPHIQFKIKERDCH